MKSNIWSIQTYRVGSEVTLEAKLSDCDGSLKMTGSADFVADMVAALTGTVLSEAHMKGMEESEGEYVQ
jgi:hypothetical protein